MNRALLRLALSFTLLLIPALAEEVKVLLDVPAPYAENVFFFPGGRYLLLVSRDPHDYNSVRFIVYDIEAKRWIPVKEKVDKRDGLAVGLRSALTPNASFSFPLPVATLNPQVLNQSAVLFHGS